MTDRKTKNDLMASLAGAIESEDTEYRHLLAKARDAKVTVPAGHVPPTILVSG